MNGTFGGLSRYENVHNSSSWRVGERFRDKRSALFGGRPMFEVSSSDVPGSSIVVEAESMDAAQQKLIEILDKCEEVEASDIHLTSGVVPYMRMGLSGLSSS